MKQETTLKTCPYCGQSKIPFKRGVCLCGKQVGSIQYISDTEKFATHYYSFKCDSEYDTAVEETFAGIEEI